MLYAKKRGATEFKELVEIKDVPESGSEPEQIEVTTLKRKRKSYVEGREDSSSQSFTYNYTEKNYFERVLPFCDGQIHEFLVIFSDNTATLITGSAKTSKKSVSLNGAVEATLTITPMNIEDKDSTKTVALVPELSTKENN